MELQISKPKRNYEGVIIMHPESAKEDQVSLFQKNALLIQQFSGEVNHVDSWGLRKLANDIGLLTRGAYFHTTFVADAECVAELERTMKINDKVLRFMHVRLDDRKAISKHLEEYRATITDSSQRDSERKAKLQAKKSARRLS